MEEFTQEHNEQLLGEPWLVRIDADNSAPYLLKFCAYNAGSIRSCCVLITDTRQVWAEVLSCHKAARRWRSLNAEEADMSDLDEESRWSNQLMSLLTTAHTLGGIADLSFEIVNSPYSDLAFLLVGPFKWRWETLRLGPRMSSEILSRHLIMPLISLNHLAFAAADPVRELSRVDLEQSLDKTARTARRSADTHVKHALSKPTVATALARVCAIFNGAAEVPGIMFEVERPELRIPEPPVSRKESAPSAPRPQAPERVPSPMVLDSLPERASPARATEPAADKVEVSIAAEAAESATESEGEHRPRLRSPSPAELNADPETKTAVPPSRPRADSSDSDAPAPPPPRKKVVQQSSASDSDAPSQPAQRTTGGARRGARQPVKRGGKRF